MSHLRVKSLYYKKGIVSCIGTANNVEPYDYKPLSWECSIEQLYKDLIEGNIKPIRGCNDYKWTVIMDDMKALKEEQRLFYFTERVLHGPRGRYALEFIDDNMFMVRFDTKTITKSNRSDKCVHMSAYRAWWLRKNMFVFKHCRVVKI